MKNLVAILSVAVIGLAAAGWLLSSRVSARSGEMEVELSAKSAELARLRDEVEQAKMLAERLQRSNDRYAARIEEMADALAREDYFPDPAPIDTVVEALPESEQPDEPAEPEEERRRRFGPPGFFLENMTEEERQRFEERRAQWEAMRQQRRDAENSFWDYEFQRAPSAAVQDRILALQEYETYVRDLRSQMRELETDEDREVLFQQLREAESTRRQLVRDHQNYMIEDWARRSGVDPDKVNVVESFRAMLNSPAFEDNDGRGGRGARGGFRPPPFVR